MMVSFRQRLTDAGIELERRWGRALSALLLSVAVLWVVVIHARVAVLPFDDAFITLRYAENVHAGEGAVYNSGERVFGSSTPLYLLWLVAARAVPSPFSLPEVAVRLNSVWLLFAGGAAFALLRRLTGSRLLAAVGAVSLVLNRSMLVASTGGMESFLFLGLVLLALSALSADRPLATGAAAGLALLTRPEGALLLPLAVLGFWRRRRRLVGAIGAWSVVVGVWVLLATIYYGTPIPHSVIAKTRPIYPLPWGTAVDLVRIGLTGLLSEVWLGRWLWLASSLVWLLLGVGAVATMLDRESRRMRSWGPAAFLAATLALYLVGNPMLFPWYWPHLFAPALLLTMIGPLTVGRLAVEPVARRWPRLGEMIMPLALGIAVLWPLFTLVGPYFRGPTGVRSPLTDVSESPERLRVLAYQQVAEGLNSVAAEGDRVAASEIGSFGFSFRGPILDGCGLVTPEAIPFLPLPASQREHQANGAISLQFVQAMDPEWVVTMPVFAKHSLLSSTWFQERYRLVGRVPLPKELWSSHEVLVLRRRNGPAPRGNPETEEGPASR